MVQIHQELVAEALEPLPLLVRPEEEAEQVLALLAEQQQELKLVLLQARHRPTEALPERTALEETEHLALVEHKEQVPLRHFLSHSDDLLSS